MPPITPDDIRRLFAGTTMPDEPHLAPLPAASARWPAEFLARAKDGLRPAGVLVPLIERSAGIAVLLTQRSSTLRVHAGQISFPGGRMDPDDADILATALREAHEEVGIPADAVEVAGFLDPSPTVTGFAVTPVIGIVESTVGIAIDPTEVDMAFEVPLDFLMDEANEQQTLRRFGGVDVPVAEFHYDGWRIWGATATMLLQLRKTISGQ